MDTNVLKAKQEMLENWNQMKSSSMEDASEHADQFQNSFYEFMETVVAWLRENKEANLTLDELLHMPEIETLLADLPDPLKLNFELEVEDFIPPSV